MARDYVEGERILADYRRLKKMIQKNPDCTIRDGDAVILREPIVRDSADGGIRVREKIRGGQDVWDTVSGQPLTRVDNNPTTYDRISVERVSEGEGSLVDRASIIYVERQMESDAGPPLQVLERWERYHRPGESGVEHGERFTRVNCKTMEILADVFTPDETDS